jgi:Tol biopolymer transport system component
MKTRISLSILMVVALFMIAGTLRSDLRGAASGMMPKVTAITQITHDGYRKTNLLSDDSNLFVTELPEANRVVAKVTLPGSERSVLPSPFASLQALDVSPDQSRLLVSSTSKTSGESEFWTLPVATGKPARVGDLNGRDASWSADGKQLVFAKDADLFVSSGDGNQAHKIYTAAGSVFAPRFSPDGKRIRFTVSDTEKNATSLWEVRRDGSKAHALLADWPFSSTACCGSWTANGRYYIFQASEALPNTTVIVTNLWVLPEVKNGESTAPTKITNGPMSFGNPSLARDNKNIWAIGVQPAVEVVKYEARKKKFVPLIAGLSATDVDFSADGKWITYVSIPEGTLWRSRADGSERLQLTTDSERAALPHWSPDGKQIAYASTKQGEPWKLSLVSASGGDAHEMLPDSGSQIDANWSANGDQLMFGDYSRDKNGLKIQVMDFKTHKITTIPGSTGLFSPRWSPDGRYIVAMSPDGTTLTLFDFTTQKWTTWLKQAESVAYPSWSSDSQYLYFDDFVTGAEAIRRLKVGASEPELVVEVGNFERYPGVLGLWSGRTPDGSWMFVRDRSTQEVYQLSLDLP